MLPFVKRKRYERALERYAQILHKWPESNKCEKSAYYMAEIHASISYRDWPKAIKYYQLVLEINPATVLPARLEIARITADKILDYARAEQLYEDCIASARVQSEKEAAAKELRKLRERIKEAEERISKTR